MEDGHCLRTDAARSNWFWRGSATSGCGAGQTGRDRCRRRIGGSVDQLYADRYRRLCKARLEHKKAWRTALKLGRTLSTSAPRDTRENGRPSADDDELAPRRTKRRNRCASRATRCMGGKLLRALVFLTVAIGRAWAMQGPAPRQQGCLEARRMWNLLDSPNAAPPPLGLERMGNAPDQPAATGRPAREDGVTTIISGNIHSLATRIGEISQWEADLVVLQETKLTAHAIKDAAQVAKEAGWTLNHGQPCRTIKRVSKGAGPSTYSAATEANSGGVATMLRKPRRDLGHKLEGKEVSLHQTGRWTRTTAALKHNGGVLTVAGVYGVSGANSCLRARKQNEAVLSQAIDLMIEAGNQPYVLMGDVNITPELSPAIVAAVNAGLIIDVGHTLAERTEEGEDGDVRKVPEPTYDKNGPMPGMQGPGVSRIDVALVNPAAMAIVRDFQLRWDLVQVDHVPIQLTLNAGLLDFEDVVQDTRGDVAVDGTPPMYDDKWDDAYQKAQEIYAGKLQTALDKGDVDDAHVQWCLFAEACLEFAKGREEQNVRRTLEGSPLRGAAPRFKRRLRRKPLDRMGHPTTFQQRHITNVINRLQEIRNRIKRFAEDPTDVAVWEKVDDEELLATMIKLWADSLHRARAVLGAEKVASTITRDLPTIADIHRLLDLLRARHAALGKDAKGRREGIRRAQKDWDWERNHGRLAFSATKVDYTPPTYSLKDPDNPRKYVTNPADIHRLFAEYWTEVFTMHKGGGQERWDAFFARYGQYIPTAQCQESPYEAQEYVDQVHRMGDTSPGFDGFTKAALKLLPHGLWHWRARLDNMAKDKGIVPSAFLHVPSPMIPKGQAAEAASHRGIVIFSILHRITFGIQWRRLREWQEQWIAEGQHGGRVGGEHLADAWDLQARIEAAIAEDNNLVGALLDYSKFFDRFCPYLVRGLLMTAGAPRGLADQLFYIISNLRRYIRVAGTYGAVISQCNGAGQGCSMSILVANLYVATLLNFLRAEHSSTEVAAFLDDRNMVAETVKDLLDAVNATRRFDTAAGHSTNVDKTALFATSPTDRDNLRRSAIDGQPLNVKLDEVMVGHHITTRRARRCTFLNERAERAMRRTDKAAAVGATKRQRTRLVQSAVIPMVVSGTLWDIPSAKQLDGLRTRVMNAVWGRTRQQRAREIVLSVLNDAARTDPLAAIAFRRLDDARRLMRKDYNRYLFARHLYDYTKQEYQGGVVYHRGVSGPMKGLHQVVSLLGGTLQLGDEGFYVDFDGNQPPLHLNEGTNAAWRMRLRTAINNAITRQLAARTIPPDDDPGERERRGKRKDLFGLGAAIDHYATTANLTGRSSSIIKRFGKIWEEVGMTPDYAKYESEEIANQRLQAVMAGSLRAPNRLHKARLVPSPSCPFCECADADLSHMLWTCPMWRELREPHLELLRRYHDRIAGERGGPQRCEELKRLLTLPCVFNCGIVPEADYFKRGGAPIPPCIPSFAVANTNLHDLDDQHSASLQRDTSGRAVAFTDGSAIFPEDPRRRRAAWGVYYAPNHPWNRDGPVHLDSQTVYAAELMAAVHVAASATVPTLIVTDCKAVADLLRAEIEGDDGPIRGDYTDLKRLLRRAVQAHPSGFFDAEWIKSHTDPADAEAAEARGGAPAAYVRGNGQADVMAKEAMRWHVIDQVEYDKADDREFLATVIQGLLETLWSNIFDRDVNMRALEDHTADVRDEALHDEHDDDGHGDEDHADHQEPRAQDPLSLPNQGLAAFVRRVSPNYGWSDALGEVETQSIIFPDLPHHTPLHRRASTLIAGRGMVNISFALPAFYADAVRWWLNRLQWPTADAVVGLPSPLTSATYLECVVDLELSSGLRLGVDGSCGTTWAAKAKALYYIVRTLARIHTIDVGHEKSAFKTALSPRPSVSALSPLGAPLQAGFARRPIWACQRTPEVVAANVWRAKAAEARARAAGTSSSTAARARTFAHDWTLTYAGYPSQDLWRPRSSIELEANIAKATREKKRALQDQRPPAPPRDRAKRHKPDVDHQVQMNAHEDVHQPLPCQPPLGMTREFKRARLNEPEVHDLGATSSTSTTIASTSTTATTPPTTNGLCTRIHSQRASSSSSGGVPRGAKRRSVISAWETDAIDCAACGEQTSFAQGRPLPLPPWLPGPWRGARPGATVCRKCYALFGATYSPP